MALIAAAVLYIRCALRSKHYVVIGDDAATIQQYSLSMTIQLFVSK